MINKTDIAQMLIAWRSVSTDNPSTPSRLVSLDYPAFY